MLSCWKPSERHSCDHFKMMKTTQQVLSRLITNTFQMIQMMILCHYLAEQLLSKANYSMLVTLMTNAKDTETEAVRPRVSQGLLLELAAHLCRRLLVLLLVYLCLYLHLGHLIQCLQGDIRCHFQQREHFLVINLRCLLLCLQASSVQCPAWTRDHNPEKPVLMGKNSSAKSELDYHSNSLQHF